MKEGIVACPIHGDNETTPNCPDCRPCKERKNVSRDISWLDRDIKRWKEIGTLIPKDQIKIYEKIRDLSCGLTVVDVGCSVGIGSNILSQQARHVWGVDINEECVRFARDMFARPNLGFELFDIENPSSREYSKFDLVVMSEVIEHLENPEKALQIIKTFFHDKTVGYINTPNKNNPKLIADEPYNELHIREYTAGEFYGLLTKHFAHVVLYSVPKLNTWDNSETIDDNSEDTPIIAKVERPI